MNALLPLQPSPEPTSQVTISFSYNIQWEGLFASPNAVNTNPASSGYLWSTLRFS